MLGDSDCFGQLLIMGSPAVSSRFWDYINIGRITFCFILMKRSTRQSNISYHSGNFCHYFDLLIIRNSHSCPDDLQSLQDSTSRCYTIDAFFLGFVNLGIGVYTEALSRVDLS